MKATSANQKLRNSAIYLILVMDDMPHFYGTSGRTQS